MPRRLNLPASLLEAFEAYGASRDEVAALILFGSAVRGDATERSDLDVGVLLTREANREGVDMLELIDDIAVLAGRDDADVVLLNRAPPLLRHRVARDGHVLYAASNRAVAEFHLRAIQDYEDTRPLRELLRKRLLAGAVEQDGASGTRGS